MNEVDVAWLAYKSDVTAAPVLTADEQEELARVVADEGREMAVRDAARDRLARSCLRLVIHLAKRFRDTPMDFDDRIGWGHVGLVRALDGYRPGGGARFSTYAASAIIRAISRALKEEWQATRGLGSDEEGFSPVAIHADHRPGPAELAERADECRATLSTLSPRDAEVIRLAFGLDGKPRTDLEIGAALGVTGQRAWQLRSRAMERLRAGA